MKDTVLDNTSVRIASVRPLGKFILQLKWRNGRSLPVDLSEPVQRLKGLRSLRDPAVFAEASVGEGGHSVVWPGELDMGAARLWERSLEQNGREDAAQFIRWRWRHGLSLSAAAEALGISRRQIAYYLSGRERVPRYILLACKGWEAEQEAAA
ncbi:MAG TPA: DUF2442 domain-containing protein [Steroidobacteraceae bacterium]|nr:DUF2442 domain-containing protein [Steroidobacteraceae bacterium]